MGLQEPWLDNALDPCTDNTRLDFTVGARRWTTQYQTVQAHSHDLGAARPLSVTKTSTFGPSFVQHRAGACAFCQAVVLVLERADLANTTLKASCRQSTEMRLGLETGTGNFVLGVLLA